jgi:hypothetical protein
MTTSFLEQLPETIAPDFASLVDDVVAIIFERNPTRFLKAHYVPMDGTEQSFIAFEFDTLAFGIVFDTEYRVALGTMGAKLPRRNDIGH